MVCVEPVEYKGLHKKLENGNQGEHSSNQGEFVKSQELGVVEKQKVGKPGFL